MLVGNSAFGRVLGPLAVLAALLGFSPVDAAGTYDEAVARALRLLPRRPDQLVIVDRPNESQVPHGRPHVEAFINRGDRVVFLVRQGVTLQATLKGSGVFDYVLATIIWHEMAHVDGADEASAQRAEEQLWREFVTARRVDSIRGMQYLALLEKRR